MRCNVKFRWEAAIHCELSKYNVMSEFKSSWNGHLNEDPLKEIFVLKELQIFTTKVTSKSIWVWKLTQHFYGPRNLSTAQLILEEHNQNAAIINNPVRTIIYSFN